MQIPLVPVPTKQALEKAESGVWSGFVSEAGVHESQVAGAHHRGRYILATAPDDLAIQMNRFAEQFSPKAQTQLWEQTR